MPETYELSHELDAELVPHASHKLVRSRASSLEVGPRRGILDRPLDDPEFLLLLLEACEVESASPGHERRPPAENWSLA